ncbi:MAG TPA: DUF1330 domain-containing protein [Dongiaceae bacterium]|nr:DUF1330 domain-containing protein [Dongiaceae bacterium]
MKAYVVVQVRVKDHQAYEGYRKQVLPTIEAHGGRFLVRGGAFSVLEGEWPLPRLVIIEFPSRQAAEGWYRSPEYQKLLAIRRRSSEANLVIVDGAS